MRFFLIIFCTALLGFACVKSKNKNPVPAIEYKDFGAKKTTAGNDTAVMVISYEDGDGDLFRDANANGPNVIGTFYYLNSATQQFTPIMDLITNDTMRITQTVLQPNVINEDHPSYRNKSVRGDMYLPWGPFRSGDSVKVFKYTLFVVDEAGNKSNIITTPTFTIDF
ncbi:MAG: hypothetical protein K0S32_1030 [Bacteroidetes bacterium]|jgi:hypothetical protein|nr:hypothetical protein [Bacteroidota bacterium]